MKTIKEWVSRQFETNSFISSMRPLSFIDRGQVETTATAALPPTPPPAGSPRATATAIAASSDLRRLYDHLAALSGDPLAKVELLQIEFLRLVLRLGIAPSHRTVQQVLQRLHLAKVIRSADAGPTSPSLQISEARTLAAELETVGQPELNLSFKILLLGATGVGKSSTINSIFSREMAETSAFEPATCQIREISNVVEGIRIVAVDTPGLRPSSTPGSQRHNRRVLRSIKRFFGRRPPPDVVLFCDRLDGTTREDHLLVKLVTEVLGSAIWYNAVLIFSHAAAVFEGPITCQALANQHARSIRRCINQAISDAQLEIPVLSVENGTSRGLVQSWRPELLLLCASMKVLADANAFLRFQHRPRLGQRGRRAPSLPHLLSSLLQPRGQADRLTEELCNLDDDDDDKEFDALPPFRALSKAQFEKLSKSQQKAYLDEVDYRETLFLKKQIKEKFRRRQQQQQSSDNSVADRSEELEQAETSVVDIAIPQSFDADYASHRYRCLTGDNDWVVRPVLDSHGWDHDVGFDGVSIEVGEPNSAFLCGQLSKDKNAYNLVAEGGMHWSSANWCDISGDIDLQAAKKGSTVMTVRAAAAKARWGHTASCGVAMTASPGTIHAVGLKLEDSVLVASRSKVCANAGLLIGRGGKLAWGSGTEMTVVGREFPAQEDRATVGLTLLAFDQELVLGGATKAEFRPCRGTKVTLDVNLNSRQLGRISLKAAGNLNLAILTVLPLLQALLRRRGALDLPPLEEEDEEGVAHW